MLSKLFVLKFLIVLVFFGSCNTDEKKDTSKHNDQKLQKESLIKVNKYLINSENIDIDNYIRRHNLTVTETGSGVKYQIIKQGNGEKAHVGKIVTLKYKIKLITGDVIYSSDETGPKQFEIGHGGVESGLEEAILNMRVGDNSIIIIPSHLAYGLLGDNNKIPPRSTIIYEIELTNIN